MARWSITRVTSSRATANRCLTFVSLVVACVISLSAFARPATADDNWATQRAAELCTQGDAHRDGGQIDVAVERYRQALELDPTYGPAYLALGRLREATGDPDEAERTYAAGIEHVAGFAEGYLARGALYLRASRGDEALVDLSSALALKPSDIAVVRRVRDASIALGKLPMALGTSRRLVALAVEQGDAATEHEARVTVLALVQIIGFIDPVADGSARNAVRRALNRSPLGSPQRKADKVFADRMNGHPSKQSRATALGESGAPQKSPPRTATPSK